MRYRVLIIDDEPNLLQGLRQVLHLEPYDLATESSPVAALARMRQEDIQVVVSDQHMSGMNGTDLLTRTREILPHSARFLMTGAPSLAMALEAINDGAVSRIFVKPFPAIVLAKAIREVMERMEVLRLSMRALEDAQHLASVLDAIKIEQPGLVERLQARKTLRSGATAAQEYFPQDTQEVLSHLRQQYG